MDLNGEISNIEDAWNLKRYDIVLALLEEDAEFPSNFDIVDLSEGTEDQKSLFEFVEERLSLHDLIRKGDIQNVKAFRFNKKSKFYLNTENESAAFTAIKSKQFRIYACLKSLGLALKNGNEQNTFDRMDTASKNAVTDALVNYFSPVSDAHIHYLISKSRSQPPMPNLVELVKNYYDQLEKIPEISIILRIIQSSDYLDIIFDLDNDNVSPVSPTVGIGTRGETRWKEGRIYIAAGPKRTEQEILGTIAHELTHMAMEMIYKNDCNPYSENEEYKFKPVRDACKKMTASDTTLSKTLLDAFGYNTWDYDNELIVRVPQIIAQYSNGKIWLALKATELFNYYKDTVMGDCKRFIRQSFLLKAKNQIQRINEKIGEIENVKKSDIYFKDVSKIKNFLNQDKNVFLLIGDNAWLSALRVLQALYDKIYIKKSDDYLIIKYSAYEREPQRIVQEFFLDGCDVLILENLQYQENFSSSDGIEFLKVLIFQRPNKKIIFTTTRGENAKVLEQLQESGFNYSWHSDKTLCLSHLDGKSQHKILEKEIIFQEKKMKVAALMKNGESLKKLIDAKTIVDLLEDKKIEIGTKALGMANLEGAYGDLLEDVNLKSLIDQILDSNDIFLFDGLEAPGESNQLFSIFSKDLKKYSENCVIKLKRELSDARRVFFEKNFSDEKFKEFCRLHPQGEIYWIKVSESTLTLRQLYNFNFYLNRKFVFYDKLYVKKEALISKSNDDIFPDWLLVSNATRESFLELFDCPKVETKLKYGKILDKMRLTFFTKDEKAKVTFEALVSSNVSVHWLKKEEDTLIWKNSHGPLHTIRKFIDKNLSKNTTIEETDLLRKIIDREVVIIADDPGMGKTTTLTKLYDSKFDSQTIVNSHWVIRINFKDHIQAIKNINLENMSIKEMIKFFSETNPNLKNNLAQNLLNNVLDSKCDFFKPLLLSFDGFDELLDENDRNKIITSLKFLKEKTKSKIWITTRLHYKDILENNLSAFAIEFEPIDDNGKEEFIKKYLKNRLKLIISTERFKNIFEGNEEPQIVVYTKKFLKKMESIFANDMTRFIGTPLQLYLMLEGILEHFKQENQTQLNFSYLGNNIMEVYKNFINKKYNIYYKKVKDDVMLFTLKQIKVIYDGYHKKLAKILILNSSSKKSTEHLQNIILSCGIIKFQDGSLEFIHHTFGEYFAAKIIFNWIKNDKKEYPLCHSKIEHVLEKILLKPDYKLVRTFLDFKINKINADMLPNENLKRFGTVMAQLLKNKENNNKTFMDVIIQEEHLQILRFAITALRYIEEDFLEFTSHLGDPILIYACRCNNSEAVKYILGKMQSLSYPQQYKLLSEKGTNGETCFHHAALYNNAEIVKRLLERAKIVCPDQLRELLTIKDVNNNTVLHLASSFIGKFYADCDEKNLEMPVKKSELFKFKSEKYSTPEKPYEFLSIDMYEQIDRIYYTSPETSSVLEIVQHSREDYLATTLNIFKDVMGANLPGHKIYELLHATNINQLTAFHLACIHGHFSLVEFILRTLEKIVNDQQIEKSEANEEIQRSPSEILYAFVLLKNEDGRNSLHMAATFNHRKIVFYLLNMLPSNRKYEILCTTDSSGSTVLHQIASKGHCQQIKIIFNELCKNKKTNYQQINDLLLLKNEEGNTALHIAAEKGHLKFLNTLIEYAAQFASLDPHELIKARGANGATVIHSAVRSSQIDVAKFLLEDKVFIPKLKVFSTLKLLDKSGKNILHTAALQENSEITELVIKRLNRVLSPEQMHEFFFLKTRDGEDVLHLAVTISNFGVAKFLIEYASKISDQNIYALITTRTKDEDPIIHRAVGFGRIEVAKFLFDQIPKDKVYSALSLTNKRGHSVLHMATFQESDEYVNLVIKKLEESLPEELILQFFSMKTTDGADILQMASGMSNLAVMNCLLDYEAKITRQDVYTLIAPKTMGEDSVIHKAIGFGRIEVAKSLLDMIPKEKVYSTFSLTNSKGNNILHMAVFQENPEFAMLVIKKLEEALTKEQIQQFFFFKTLPGNNVLHMAAIKSSLTVVKFLLEYATTLSASTKYDLINTRGMNEGTVVHRAVGLGKIEVAEYLFELIPEDKVYCTLGLADKNGNNVLHMAAYRNDRAFAQLVVEKLRKSSPLEELQEILLFRNSDGVTAVHLAKKKAHSDVEAYLSDIQKWCETMTLANSLKKVRKKPSRASKQSNLKIKIFC